MLRLDNYNLSPPPPPPPPPPIYNDRNLSFKNKHVWKELAIENKSVSRADSVHIKWTESSKIGLFLFQRTSFDKLRKVLS